MNTARLNLIAKLALAGVIIYLTVSNGMAAWEWWRGPLPVASVEQPALETAIQPPQLPPLLLSAFDEGAWEFAGMPWQVRMATVKSPDLDRELQALPPADQLTAGVSSVEGHNLLAMLRATGAKERQLGLLKLLESGNSAGRLMLVSRAGPKGEELILGRIAWAEGGAWRLVEGRPAHSAIANKLGTSAVPPLPAEAEVLGTRWGNDGAFLGQIVSLAGPRGALVESWKAAGWSVARAPIEATSADDPPLLLVERKGIGFSAHFFASPEGPITLFLTRVPE